MTSRTTDILLTAMAPAIWGSTYIVTTELLPANYRKQSINHALARDVGTDRRRTAYAPPSSRFQGSSAS